MDEGEDLTVRGGEVVKCRGEPFGSGVCWDVVSAAGQAGGGVGSGDFVSKPGGEGLASTVAAVAAGQGLPGDAEHPHTCWAGFDRHGVDSSPDHHEDVAEQIGCVGWVRDAAREVGKYCGCLSKDHFLETLLW